MQIDLGAVGKGYAGDLVAEDLKKNGVESALIDLGGNIQTVGTKPDGGNWKVGIRSPFGEGNFAVLRSENARLLHPEDTSVISFRTARHTGIFSILKQGSPRRAVLPAFQ